MKNKPELNDEAPAVFDIDALDAADEGQMIVYANGRRTNWVWRFAGPGHPKSIAQSQRIAREQLREEREKEQARVNGKKWKAPDESPDEIRRKNANFIIERLLGWSEATVGGQPFPFSEENALKLLLDPKKHGLVTQCLEFLGEEKSFTPRSATNSSNTPGETSN